MTHFEAVPAPAEAEPELRHPFPIARIGEGARVVVEAAPDARRALAQRMGLVAIHTLTCRFDLVSEPAGRIAAHGLLRARIRQTCVVSLEPFDSDIVEDFRIRFVPEGREDEAVDIESDDEVPYQGAVLELGEAASEQLALALDPFPRIPGAELPGAAPAHEGGAFAALAKLRPPA